MFMSSNAKGGFVATSRETLTNEHPPEYDPGYAQSMGIG